MDTDAMVQKIFLTTVQFFRVLEYTVDAASASHGESRGREQQQLRKDAMALISLGVLVLSGHIGWSKLVNRPTVDGGGDVHSTVVSVDLEENG